ncbi:protein FANTASTIC FOUR 1-like [Trifolium pratense]|uniref:protein FANTASTIC FOUR 1-like n=1 Tax=Trifolium pratense TaxID=57577 RepID=UPI001E6903BB|nr:protein FANTASTIC FOUR 1-like [Trifolium pratense]
MTDSTTLFLYYPISIILSFSLSFIFPSLINLFKKNLHSVSGLAIVTADNRIDPVPMSNSKPDITEITIPPRIGFVSGDCTESLGFESCDERRINDDDGMNVNCDENENDEIWRRKMMMKKAESRGNWMRSFPPPLTSLNRNGKPSFYLRPVRKDGRLELTEVRIHRPDILHASRHDGRLTLHLIPDPDQEEEDDEEDEQQEELEEEEEEEEEENRGIRMVVGNSNEGLKRCHEMVNRVHGNHHLQMCGISIV